MNGMLIAPALTKSPPRLKAVLMSTSFGMIPFDISVYTPRYRSLSVMGGGSANGSLRISFGNKFGAAIRPGFTTALTRIIDPDFFKVFSGPKN